MEYPQESLPGPSSPEPWRDLSECFSIPPELFQDNLLQGYDIDYAKYLKRWKNYYFVGYWLTEVWQLIALLGNVNLLQTYLLQLPNELMAGKIYDHYGRGLLHLTALSGNLEAFQLLAEKEYLDLWATDNDGSSVLHFAAVGGNEILVRYLIENFNFNVRQADYKGQTVFHAGIVSGNVELVNYLSSLIDEKDLFHTGKKGENAMHYAAISWSLSVIQLLQQKGFHLDTKDFEGRTPLHYLAASGDVNTFLGVLKLNPKLDLTEQCSCNFNCVDYAVTSGNPEMFESLWALADAKNNAAIGLRRAIRKDLKAVKNYILETYGIGQVHLLAISGIDNFYAQILPDLQGNTAQHYAVLSGDLTSIQRLISKGLLLTDKNNDGLMPLDILAYSGNEKLWGEIWECYPDLDYEDIADATMKKLAPCFAINPLWLKIAALTGHVSMMRYLVEKYKIGTSEIKFEESNFYDDASFAQWAAWSGNPLAVNYILSLSPEAISRLDVYGRNILCYAAHSGNVALLIMLKKQFEKKHIDPKLSEALFHAVCSGNSHIVEYLIEQGVVADISLLIKKALEKQFVSCIRCLAKISLMSDVRRMRESIDEFLSSSENPYHGQEILLLQHLGGWAVYNFFFEVDNFHNLRETFKQPIYYKNKNLVNHMSVFFILYYFLAYKTDDIHRQWGEEALCKVLQAFFQKIRGKSYQETLLEIVGEPVFSGDRPKVWKIGFFSRSVDSHPIHSWTMMLHEIPEEILAENSRQFRQFIENKVNPKGSPMDIREKKLINRLHQIIRQSDKALTQRISSSASCSSDNRKGKGMS